MAVVVFSVRKIPQVYLYYFKRVKLILKEFYYFFYPASSQLLPTFALTLLSSFTGYEWVFICTNPFTWALTTFNSINYWPLQFNIALLRKQGQDCYLSLNKRCFLFSNWLKNVQNMTKQLITQYIIVYIEIVLSQHGNRERRCVATQLHWWRYLQIVSIPLGGASSCASLNVLRLHWIKQGSCQISSRYVIEFL